MKKTKSHAPQGDEPAASHAKKATHVDTDLKRKNQQRLARIEGQVRGIRAMIDDDRYCADVLVQISAVQEALRGVSLELLRNHLQALRDARSPATRPRTTAMVEEAGRSHRRFAR
ncbi:MAG: metal-sensing transcriptional repressor [Polyangiaceae bacterium]